MGVAGQYQSRHFTMWLHSHVTGNHQCHRCVVSQSHFQCLNLCTQYTERLIHDLWCYGDAPSLSTDCLISSVQISGHKHQNQAQPLWLFATLYIKISVDLNWSLHTGQFFLLQHHFHSHTKTSQRMAEVSINQTASFCESKQLLTMCNDENCQTLAYNRAKRIKILSFSCNQPEL